MPSFERDRRKLTAQFDGNHDQRLSREERTTARQFLTNEKASGTQPRSAMPPPARAMGALGKSKPAVQGRAIAFEPGPTSNAPLYDPEIVRTLFLDFEDSDWESQLSDFYDTDIEVPAILRIEGSVLQNVGTRFRGMSSYGMVPVGYKRSLNLSLNAFDRTQSWRGVRTLNLLNSHEDPTFLRAVLYLEIAQHYLPAPRANHIRVVINGHDWGAYVNAEQFNADFVEHWYKTRKGARFKVPGSPMGRGGLEYLGEDKTAYEKRYRLNTKDSPQVWSDLIRLCKTLNQTPLAQLEAALQPLLDIEGTLRFLALENVFINGDGYWIRASDYNLYQDERGRFHVIPHDANETFQAQEHGPGFVHGQGPGVQLEPLFGMDDASKPLRSRLLKVPALRQRYLSLVREIATVWLDWKRLGPIIEAHRSRIDELVKADTRKLDSYEDFQKGILDGTLQSGPCGPEKRVGLKRFAEERRAYLLNSD